MVGKDLFIGPLPKQTPEVEAVPLPEGALRTMPPERRQAYIDAAKRGDLAPTIAGIVLTETDLEN